MRRTVDRNRWGWGLAAAGCTLAGGLLTAHHPVSPVGALSLFWLWCLLAAWRPGLWLCVVPAALPFMNFAPWTGWLIFDEFDLLVLGALAGGYARLAGSVSARRWPSLPTGLVVLLGLMVLVLVQALLRGVADAGGWAFDWFASYPDALNSVRVFKGPALALLCVPLIRDALAQSAALACRRLAAGMVMGLVVVVLATLWERAAFPGFTDFSTNYRTVALFWEMHVGGAAIDTYLALAAPFAMWALVSARHPAAWAGAALLALLVGHACLTTFSRGVYLGVVLPLLMLGAWIGASKAGWSVPWPRVRVPFAGWRVQAAGILVLALVAEMAWVLGGGTFMAERLSRTERDFVNRYDHWQSGLSLLETPADWLLGLGMGRLPANYATRVTDGAWPGAVTVVPAPAAQDPRQGYAVISGPAASGKPRGAYALTQRVGALSGGWHGVQLRVRASVRTDLLVELCERHLLYDRQCQSVRFWVTPQPAGDWLSVRLPLRGPDFSPSPWYAPRLAMLALSVSQAGGQVEVDQAQLVARAGSMALLNPDFSEGLARWYPAAQSYFVPWHIDNVYLERLLDQGLIGLLLSGVLTLWALHALVLGRARGLPLAPYLTGSVLAILVVGLVSNALDVPRVSFLFDLLVLFSVLGASSGACVNAACLDRLEQRATHSCDEVCALNFASNREI